MNSDLWNQIGLGPTGFEKLRRFEVLVGKWTQKINLIARSTVPEIWSRHIEDSARIWLNAPHDLLTWADFGSGGGFPGIVLAVIAQDRRSPTRFTFVESDQRKAAFLREAARDLAISVSVLAERAEKLNSIQAGVVSARALASLDQLCGTWERHGAAESIALFPKGETWAEEVATARKNWSFDLESFTDPGHKGSALLKLRNLHRVGRTAHA